MYHLCGSTVTIFAKCHQRLCCKWKQLSMNLCRQSQPTLFLSQPPGLIRSHKKFLRLKVCKRIVNLPSPGSWMGNEKVQLSHSVTVEDRGNNPIGLFPAKAPRVSVRVPPSLFRRFIVLCHGGKTSVGADKKEEMLHLSYAHSQRNFGEFTASEKWQLVRFQGRSFGAAPNRS